MNRHVKFALDYPVFDPGTQIVAGHFWDSFPMRFGLTCNIGME